MKTFNEQEWLRYRAENLEMRFWQALRNYMDVSKIWTEEEENQLRDTFYIKDK